MTFFGWHGGLTKAMLGAAARPWHRWVPESVWHLAHLLRRRLGEEGEDERNAGRQ